MFHLSHVSLQVHVPLISCFTISSCSTYLMFHYKFMFYLSQDKVLFFEPACLNWQYCKLGTKRFLRFLLIVFHQLIFQTGIFGTVAFLILYFHLQQVLFQQAYFLFLRWLIIAQTQYWNIETKVAKKSFGKVRIFAICKC